MLKDNQKTPIARVGQLFGGFLSGALSWIPFFNTKPLNEAMLVRDYDFPETSLGEKFWFNFKKKWTFLLGALLGGFFFFLLPINYLTDNYTQIIYIALGALALGFIPVEIYQLFKNKKNDNLITLLGIFIAVAICFWTYNIKAVNIDFTSYSGYLTMFFLLFVSTLLATISGQAIGSLFFLSSAYLEVSNLFADLTRFYLISDYKMMLLCSLLGVFCGYIIGFAFKTKFKFSNSISNGINLGFSISAIIILLAFKIEYPFYTDISTELAQQFVIIVVPVAFFLIALVLSARRFTHLRKGKPLLEKLELQEEKKNLTLYEMLTFGLDRFFKIKKSKQETIPVDSLNTAQVQTKEAPFVETKEDTPNKETTGISDKTSGLDINLLQSLADKIKDEN